MNTNSLTPARVITVSYLYLGIISIVLYVFGFYRNNDFFAWGPPVEFFKQNIDTQVGFYCLHLLIFIHQLFNNTLNTVAYPWIINSVQDCRNNVMEYSRYTSLILINLFNLYSQLDLIIIVMGFSSQISFVITISIANALTSTYINNVYLRMKEENSRVRSELTEDPDFSLF